MNLLDKIENAWATIVIGIAIFFITIVGGVVIGNNLYPVYREVSDIIDNMKRPSYDYLSKVSVYIFHSMKITEDREMGATGSGTIVAKRGGYFYILTNRHVCDSDAEGSCFVIPDGDVRDGFRLPLIFVKSSDETHDLSLWKVDSVLLLDREEIKGIGNVYIQDRVYSVGQYLGLNAIYTEGVLAGFIQYQSQDVEPLFNLPCAPGCSGSGIFNSKGELVSVIYAGNMVDTSMTFVRSFDTSKAIGQANGYLKYFLEEFIVNE